MKCLRLLFCVLTIGLSLAASLVHAGTPNPNDCVDPFVGTDAHGHTFPGAVMPFGMVQLSPDTRTDTWDGCSGYNYSDPTIMGFSHTHLLGTGGGCLGDILLMPTVGNIHLDAGQPGAGYISRFSHKRESAQPGYYRVYLQDPRVTVELTATERCGFHRYTFPATDAAHIVLDLDHGIQNGATDSQVKVENSTTLTGYRQSNGWGGTRIVYYVMQFSRPFQSWGLRKNGQLLPNGTTEASGGPVKAYVSYQTKANDQILIKVGISPTSIEEARKNLAEEIPGWDFRKVRTAAAQAWNQTLSPVQIDTPDPHLRRTFYTNLYFSEIAPSLYNDSDGSYRGMDHKIHNTGKFQNYTTFSIWDTYRAEQPLLLILQPHRSDDMINTLLTQYSQSGIHRTPIWPLWDNETWCMIGYHSVDIIADAYLKGVRGDDPEAAYQAMRETAVQNDLAGYKTLGYIPSQRGSQATSRTIESGYDDWCIAKMAAALGHNADAQMFYKCAADYYNLYDKTTDFLRGRLADGSWRPSFDAIGQINDEYTEADAWEYAFAVQQDIPGVIRMYGGDAPFINKLDTLFAMSSKTRNFDPDISGMIGQYSQGDEQCHHVAYLYDYAGAPYKTQYWARQVMQREYQDTPAGECGNLDCGQMSAWYIFSAMGFYPVNPDSGVYEIGSPVLNKVVLHLDPKAYGGRTFTVIAQNNSPKNIYIQSAAWNGQPFQQTWFTHRQLIGGGVLRLVMGPKPNLSWGASAPPPATMPAGFQYPTPPTPSVETIVKLTVPIRVVCGSDNPVGNFVPDPNMLDGQENSTDTVVDANVPDAAPAAVYQSERYGNDFTYEFPVPKGHAYTAHLHFSEDFDKDPGVRLENIAINGTTVLTNFDVYTASGGMFKAIVKSFSGIKPDAHGIISVRIWSASTSPDKNAKISAIEILPIRAVAGSKHATEFKRSFAPSEGMVTPQEQPYRQEICLNGTWQFQPVAVPSNYTPNVGVPPDLSAPNTDGWDSTPIKIPSPWNVNAFNMGNGGDFRCYPSYPKAWENAQMGWLRHTFRVPANWSGKRFMLHFDAIAGNADIYVNGHKVGENFDIFLPAEYDVTNDIKPGAANVVLVGVRKPSLFDDRRTIGSRPYPGGSMWGTFIAGIWQDVFLDAEPALHVANAYVEPEVSKDILQAQVTLRNDTQKDQTVTVNAQVNPWINLAGNSVLEAPEPKWRLGDSVLSLQSQTVKVPANSSKVVTLSGTPNGALKLWTPDAPNLYGLQVSLSEGTTQIDCKYTRFGWREFSIYGSRFLLNGKPIQMRGDSWHFLGIPEMTRRYAWAWFKALKDANGNAVRLHAEPYPSFFMDMADQMGVCVLDETAIWGSDEGHKYDSPDFWTRCNDHVARLILRDRNHPSVLGWSVSNELGFLLGDGNYQSSVPLVKQGWTDWLATERSLDPTRPWVSTDGDGDADGIMPTSIRHYTSPQDIVRTDKPYGEGEAGGAYFASPKYAAQFVGPVAYDSQQGRMEGLAIEAYELIEGQRAVNASYCSVFNLVWYGLQPLALGLSDTSRPYTIDDGIFFGPYREGQPGVQPERLGPYCSTLNPGYDPKLPLYRTWPLADAIKAAYAPGGPAPSPWDHRISPTKSAAAPAPTIRQIVVLANENSSLAGRLNALGANVAKVNDTAAPQYVVIDGLEPPTDPALRGKIAQWVNGGATCLVIDPEKTSIEAVDALLPISVQLSERSASSLVIKDNSTVTAGMDDSDFYYTETLTHPIIRHGLSGPFVDKGRVLLEACNADWSTWNNAPEPIKTAALLRSEREEKPAGAALVQLNQGSGRYLLTTIDLQSNSSKAYEVIKSIMTNTGVVFSERKEDSETAFDMFGRLNQALVCGSFPAATVTAAYDTDNIGIGPDLKPQPGNKSGGLDWRVAKITDDGLFDFLRLGLPGPTETAASYLSFWIWSPRPLDNLLVEPNMPKLDLLMGSDDGCQVWLNSKLIKEDRGTHPVVADSIICDALPLQRGWNHLVVKVVQGSGQWQYEARLQSSIPEFLEEIKSSASSPQE